MTSNLSFSHRVFYPFGELFAILVKYKIVQCKIFQFGRLQNLLFWKELSLSLTTNFRLKEFADDNFKFHENVRQFSKQVKNTVGKGEIAY